MDDPIIYLDGRFLPKSQASMSIEDRGTHFGDGVYEVTRWYDGKPFEVQAHLDRLWRSMNGIALTEPPLVAELPRISDELVERNGLRDAEVYWQVTRGPAKRDRLFPETPRPTVLALAYPLQPLARDAASTTWAVIFTEDTRWSNCHIKALVLLPTVLTRNAAHAAGFDDAIYQRDGIVTETTGANVFLVRHGELHTHPADRWILHGITRRNVLELAATLSVPTHERTFTVEELLAADEVFITGTTIEMVAVTRIDEQAFETGPITSKLHEAYVRRVLG